VEDVAAEKEYCSSECRAGARAAQLEGGLTTDAEMLAAYATPIRSGWKLWFRAMGPLALYTAPAAVVLGYALTETAADVEGEGGFGLAHWLFFLAGAVGIAVAQVVLSQKYVGHAVGNPYSLVMQRFLPWIAAFVLTWGLIIGGYLVLIVPGIYLSLRLFWAEEFALVHGAGPIQAIRESWDLTTGSAGAVFGFQFLAGLAAYGVFVAVGLAAVSVGAALEVLPTPISGTLRMVLVCWAMLIGYGGLHAPEIVYLYGMRAERSTSFGEASRTFQI